MMPEKNTAPVENALTRSFAGHHRRRSARAYSALATGTRNAPAFADKIPVIPPCRIGRRATRYNID